MPKFLKKVADLSLSKPLLYGLQQNLLFLGMLRVKGRPGSTRDPWPVTKEGILTRPDPARGFFEAFLTRPDPARQILDLTRPDPAREKSQRPARPVMVFSLTRPTRDFFILTRLTREFFQFVIMI